MIADYLGISEVGMSHIVARVRKEQTHEQAPEQAEPQEQPPIWRAADRVAHLKRRAARPRWGTSSARSHCAELSRRDACAGTVPVVCAGVPAPGPLPEEAGEYLARLALPGPPERSTQVGH